MSPEPANVISPDAPPASSAELCLYLIMIQPEMETRRLHIKDFCRLYEIKEKRPSEPENPLNRIANAMRANPQPPIDEREHIVSRPPRSGAPTNK